MIIKNLQDMISADERATKSLFYIDFNSIEFKETIVIDLPMYSTLMVLNSNYSENVVSRVTIVKSSYERGSEPDHIYYVINLFCGNNRLCFTTSNKKYLIIEYEYGVRPTLEIEADDTIEYYIKHHSMVKAIIE